MQGEEELIFTYHGNCRGLMRCKCSEQLPRASSKIWIGFLSGFVLWRLVVIVTVSCIHESAIELSEYVPLSRCVVLPTYREQFVPDQKGCSSILEIAYQDDRK